MSNVMPFPKSQPVSPVAERIDIFNRSVALHERKLNEVQIRCAAQVARLNSQLADFAQDIIRRKAALDREYDDREREIMAAISAARADCDEKVRQFSRILASDHAALAELRSEPVRLSLGGAS